MDEIREFLREHPQVLLYGAAVLVAFDVLNLLSAMELVADLKRAIADAQRAASEALGG
jgi:hypothetical protein